MKTRAKVLIGLSIFLFLTTVSFSQNSNLNKVLFIGNSYTGHMGGIHNHFQKMLEESGRTNDVFGEIHGGEAFSYQNETHIGHVHNQEVTDRINSNNWDAVILQSYVAETADSFNINGKILIDRVRNNGYDSEAVLFMFWGSRSYPKRDSLYKNRCEQLGNEKNVLIVPISVGIRNAQNQGIEVFSDNEHLSLKGSYLAAAMFYSFFTKQSPVGLTYDGACYYGTLIPEETEPLQQIAWQTINDYGVFWNKTDNSEFNYVFGDALYPFNPGTKPAKGESYIDPNFGTTITRITDGEADVPNAGIYPEYGTWRSVNYDGTKLLFVDRTGNYRIHSANPPYETVAIWKPDWSTNGGLGHEQPEYRWDYSGEHPDWLYWRSYKKLYRTSVDDLKNISGVLYSNNSINVVVHNFENDRAIIEDGTPLTEYVWNNAVIANGDAGTSSEDSRYWAFALYTADANGKTFYRIFIYDKTADTVVSAKNVESGYVNEVYMSPDGNYIYVGFNAKEPYNSSEKLGGAWIYKRDLSNWGNPTFYMCSGPPHTNWMYDAQGYVGMLYMDNQTDYLTFKRAVDGTEWNIRYHTQGEGGDWGRAGKHHGAMSGPHKKGWGLVTTYSTEYFNHQGWDDDDIYLVEVDENKYYGGPQEPRVWRIATLNNNSTVNYYFYHPNTSMNYGGTKIWYCSNWGVAGGIQDVYQIDLPQNWWNDLTGDTTTSVSPDLETPNKFMLNQNYPNPFNPTTNISFTLPVQSRVRLTIYNVLGQQITELVNENIKAGIYNYTFDASSFSSGVYFYNITTDSFTETKRMILMK